jgi:asparagine synthase (glutamine-hydrolysing)
MASNLANAATDGFELDLRPELKCRIMSAEPLQNWQDENCTLIILGSIQYNSQAVSAEQLASIYLQNPNLDKFYSQLRGRFALLIFDPSSNQLNLFIDPMGIQTCCYTLQDGCIYVSESLDRIKSCAGVSCSISEQAIFNYFYFHCIPAPSTIYSECCKLEPGRTVTFNSAGEIESAPLFHPEFASGCDQPVALERECLQVIDEAVAIYANENCGAFLSGGLDSSTIAGMLAKHQPGASTFSIGFENPDYDETSYAKITAKHFKTKHEVLYLTADQAASELVRVAQFFEEPFGNSSAMAAYFCAQFAKSHGIDTLLAGDGGDELFAGNSHYAKQKQFELFYRAPRWLRTLLRFIFDNKVTSRLPLLGKAASYIRQADVPLPDRLGTYNFVQQYGVDEMFNHDFLTQVNCQEPALQQRKRYLECSSENPVDRMLYLDWKFTLADNDLVKVKKMCELAGVNVHFPLLDRSVVDFSCRVPASTKLPGHRLRDFYKKACKGFLPDATLSKSKHGFGLPFGIWMNENETLMKLSIDCLESFRARNIVNDSLIENALKAHSSVHAGYYGELIWIIVTLELWLQRES